MLVDKPVGWTSHDVVAAVRRRLGIRSVGHAGTLDPFATGLLVVLVGRATRLARFVEGLPKTYETEVRFGAATDTDDATGRVVQERVPNAWPGIEVLRDAAQGLTGTMAQRPPAFSAKHIGGTRSYVLARAGQAIMLEPVSVTVHSLDVTGWEPPVALLTATVGRGTYIRSLVRDLGERLDTVAHCTALRRTVTGSFRVDHAIGPDDVVAERLIPPATLLRHLPRQVLSSGDVRDVSFGRSVAQQVADDGPVALVADDGRLVAVGECREGRCHPSVVLEPAA